MLRRTSFAFPVVISLAAAMACSPQDTLDEGPRDIVAPELVVESPARGTTTLHSRTWVEGRVFDADSGIDTVTVAGIAAEVDEAGFYRVEVPLVDGLNLLRTVVVDRHGNETDDTRAVLSGRLNRTNQMVPNAGALAIRPSLLATIADTAEQAFADEVDLFGLATQDGPFEFGSGCTQANLEITSITYDDLSVTLKPVEGGLRARVTMSNLKVDGHSEYSVFCIEGSAGIELTAERIELVLELHAAVEDGIVLTDLDEHRANFVDLELDVGGIPSTIAEIFIGELDTKVGDVLSWIMGAFLNPRVSDALTLPELAKTVEVLETELSVAAVPMDIAFTSAGGIISVGGRLTSPGDRGLGFLHNPEPLPKLDGTDGASLWISDDSINQGLYELWGAGVLDQTFELSEEDGDAVGGIADRIAIAAPLPPVVQPDGNGQMIVTLGDLYVTLLQRDSETPYSEIAISVQVAVDAEINDDDELQIGIEWPTIEFDRLDDGSNLGDRDLEVLVPLAAEILQNQLDDIIGTLPLPSFYGTKLADPTVRANGGYLQVGASLSRP